MDQRVEKLETEVGSLTTDQQQIMEKLTELVDKLNSQTVPQHVDLNRQSGS